MAIVYLFLEWYFVDVPKKIFKIWASYFWFWGRYFSVAQLFSHLFSPWHNLQFSNQGQWSIGSVLGNALFNFFSAIIGFIARIFIILAGIVFEIITLALGIVAFLIWVALPIAIVASIVFIFTKPPVL